MIDDCELLRRYRDQGSQDAFRELISRHLNLIYAAALRQTRNAHDAEEVVQTVFADLARKSAALVNRPVLISWLYQSTHFAAAKVNRTEFRRRLRDQAAFVLNIPSANPESSADWDRIRPALDAAMAELDDSARTAVLLRFFQGQTFAEIGALLQTTEEAARKRVERGVEKLRGKLSSRGITSTSAGLALALINQPAVAAPVTLVIAVPSFMPAAAIIPLMGSLKTTLTLTGIALLLAGTIVYQREVLPAREALVAKNHELSLLEQQLAQGGNHPPAKPAAQNNASIPQRTGTSGFGLPTPDYKALVNNPELEAAYLDQYRSSLRPFLARLYTQLGLSPDQITQYEALLIDRAQARLDIAFSGMANGMAWNDPALKNLVDSETSELTKQIEAIVSKQQLDEYQRNQWGRMVTQELDRTLSSFDSLLTPEQSAALTSSVAARVGNDETAFDWQPVLKESQAILTPSQFSIFDEMLADFKAHQLIHEARLEALRSANTGSP